jgi:23S rRNA (adenine-N6)-dimethyltransferase
VARRVRTERDVRRRTLSQNFLADARAARLFLDRVEVEPDGLVLEVGAGAGALTEALAERAGTVVAYELDPELAGRLAERLRGRAGVRVEAGDFLAARPPGRRFQVVGNVPFSITSDVVAWCLAAPALASATLITQLEYARKRAGDYGRWSLVTVRTWPEFSWELRGRIPRGRFRPVPRVDAGILHLARRERPLVPPARMPAYARMVEQGFTGVGGSLYESLRRAHPPARLAAAFGAAGVDRAAVVAFVTPEQWLALFAALEPGR